MIATIARLKPVWLALIPIALVADAALRRFQLALVPVPVGLGVLFVLVALFLVSPRPRPVEPVELDPPVRGRWVALNGPGSKVPSHGTNGYGQRYAVDLIQPADADVVPLARKGLRTSRPEEYPCFGADVLSMAPGTVVLAADGQRDHNARNTWIAAVLMMTIEAVARSFGGFAGLAGNRIVVAHDDETFAVYAHLRHGSARVQEGERVETGQVLASVGNTGNTSEPHLHVQVMERRHPAASVGLPMRWRGITPTGEEDPRLAPWVKPPHPSAMDVVPANGRVFDAAGRRD